MGRRRSLRLVVFLITQRLEERKYDTLKREYKNQKKTRLQNRRKSKNVVQYFTQHKYGSRKCFRKTKYQITQK